MSRRASIYWRQNCLKSINILMLWWHLFYCIIYSVACLTLEYNYFHYWLNSISNFILLLFECMNKIVWCHWWLFTPASMRGGLYFMLRRHNACLQTTLLSQYIDGPSPDFFDIKTIITYTLLSDAARYAYCRRHVHHYSLPVAFAAHSRTCRTLLPCWETYDAKPDIFLWQYSGNFMVPLLAELVSEWAINESTIRLSHFISRQQMAHRATTSRLKWHSSGRFISL